MYRNQDGIEFLRNLPAQSVDGIFTDPPWGSGPKIIGQDIWKELIQQMAEESLRILKPNGKVLVWIGTAILANTLKALSCLEYKWSIYVDYVPGRYVSCFESRFDIILFLTLPMAPLPVFKNKIRQIYQNVSNPADRKKHGTRHPCAKPFISVENILNDWFKEGDYIIDPFAGSDTFGVSCRLLNLKYDSCEIDPMMYQTGLKRNEQEIMDFK